MLIEVVITKQDGVGIDQRQMPQMVRDGPRETVPFLGNMRPTSSVIHRTSEREVVVTKPNTIAFTRWR